MPIIQLAPAIPAPIVAIIAAIDAPRPAAPRTTCGLANAFKNPAAPSPTPGPSLANAGPASPTIAIILEPSPAPPPANVAVGIAGAFVNLPLASRVLPPLAEPLGALGAPGAPPPLGAPPPKILSSIPPPPLLPIFPAASTVLPIVAFNAIALNATDDATAAAVKSANVPVNKLIPFINGLPANNVFSNNLLASIVVVVNAFLYFCVGSSSEVLPVFPSLGLPIPNFASLSASFSFLSTIRPVFCINSLLRPNVLPISSPPNCKLVLKFFKFALTFVFTVSAVSLNKPATSSPGFAFLSLAASSVASIPNCAIPLVDSSNAPVRITLANCNPVSSPNLVVASVMNCFLASCSCCNASASAFLPCRVNSRILSSSTLV